MTVEGRSFDKRLGTWRFHVELGWKGLSDIFALQIAAADRAAMILDEEGLMRPRRLTASGWVSRAAPAAVAEMPPITISLNKPRNPNIVLRELHEQLDQRTPLGTFPSVVRVEGLPNAVIDNDVLDNRITVVSDGPGSTVSLETFSDAWMAFDIYGHAQRERAEIYAPLLTRALRRLADELDAEVDPGEPTRYGTPTETGLENARDSYDKLIPADD